MWTEVVITMITAIFKTSDTGFHTIFGKTSRHLYTLMSFERGSLSLFHLSSRKVLGCLSSGRHRTVLLQTDTTQSTDISLG